MNRSSVIKKAEFWRIGWSPLCRNTCIELLYLPPCSPNFNPIEEFFAELKRFITLRWQTELSQQDFAGFLECYVQTVSVRGRSSARNHFRNAGITIENVIACIQLAWHAAVETDDVIVRIYSK